MTKSVESWEVSPEGTARLSASSTVCARETWEVCLESGGAEEMPVGERKKSIEKVLGVEPNLFVDPFLSRSRSRVCTACLSEISRLDIYNNKCSNKKNENVWYPRFRVSEMQGIHLCLVKQKKESKQKEEKNRKS